MDRTVKSLAKRVAAGSKTALPDFKSAMLAFGWEGRRGLGVVHTAGWHHKSWADLAADVLENGVQLPYEAPAKREEMDAAEEAEAEEYRQDIAEKAFLTDHVEREPFTYFYTERTITQPFRTERIVTIIGLPR